MKVFFLTPCCVAISQRRRAFINIFCTFFFKTLLFFAPAHRISCTLTRQPTSGRLIMYKRQFFTTSRGVFFPFLSFTIVVCHRVALAKRRSEKRKKKKKKPVENVASSPSFFSFVSCRAHEHSNYNNKKHTHQYFFVFLPYSSIGLAKKEKHRGHPHMRQKQQK